MNLPASSISALQRRLDATTDRAIAERRIVGSVILVAEDGAIVYRRAAGFIDREAGTPMRADAIFRMASCTKPIVAATALAMVECGMLSLDGAVSDYLPEFRPKLRDGGPANILVRHLLSHTAGLTYPSHEPGDPYRAANIASGLDGPGIGMAATLQKLAAVPLLFAPGTSWKYSMAIDVLGEVVARVHGGTTGEAVAAYVTGPLAMKDTDFRVTDPERLAVPYADGVPEPLRMPDPYMVPVDARNGAGTIFSPSRIFNAGSFQSGGAGMAGTAGDFLVFLEAIRKGGSPILKPETIALASQNHIADFPMDERDAGWRFGLLSGVIADPAAAGSPQSKGTLQWGGAYGHNWFIDQPRRLTVVEFTNTAFEGCNGGFRDEVRNAVYG